MNGIAEVREEYKQAAREYIRQTKLRVGIRSLEFYEGKKIGLGVALDHLGVNSDERQDMYKTCEVEVLDEKEQEKLEETEVNERKAEREDMCEEDKEELDAIERPVAQAQVESDEVTLEHIRARFASPATSADIRNAVQAFEEGFKELDR